MTTTHELESIDFQSQKTNHFNSKNLKMVMLCVDETYADEPQTSTAPIMKEFEELRPGDRRLSMFLLCFVNMTFNS
uniref:Uncharacterized protein n=1 Tax=Acrobeloides nanus TaxID=290746 RepID=A0A914D2L7_9BILA